MSIKTIIYFMRDQAVPLFVGKRAERFGGAEVQVYDLASHLAKQDDFDCVFLMDKEEIAKEYSHPNITFTYLKPPIQRGVPLLSRIENKRRLLAPFPQEVRKVMLLTGVNPRVMRAAEISRQVGAKFVYRVSSDADIDGSLITNEATRNRFIEAIVHADGVVAQTDWQARRFHDLYGRTAKVIKSGLAVPEPRKEESDRDVIIWIGRCVSLKRPWHFLELARAFPDEKFVMLLGQDDLYLQRWILQDAICIDNLDIIFDVPYAKTWDYLRRAKLFVGTSAMEGSPVTYLQAMAAGAPILSLAYDGGLAEQGLMSHGQDNIERLKAMLADALQNPEELRVQSVRAWDYFGKHHAMDVCVGQYRGFFQSLFR